MRHGTLVPAALLLLACSGGDSTTGDDAALGRDSLAADSPAQVPAAAPNDSTLTPEGWGPLRIGMTRAQIVAAAGEDANAGLIGGPEPGVCDQFRPTDVPEDMVVMVERDTLTRITIMRDSDVRTDRGFGIGDSASAILAAYGPAATSSPHEYRDAPSAYITVWTTPPGGPAPARGIVYDIGNDGLVSLVHAGAESITYVEGCV